MAVDIPIRVIIDAIDNASKNLKNVAANAGNLGSAITTLGIAGAAVGATAVLLGKNFIEAAGAMEQNQVAFETMIGSAQKATVLLQQMSEFAKRTPFNLPELVEGGKRLLAYNVEAKDLIPTLDMLGNITAGVGREKLPALILAFGQVKAATRLTGMELRQFSEAGVPLIDTLAKQFGVTAGEIQKMTSEGTIKFKDVEKALQSLTGEGGKFHDLMQKQSETTLGKVSNLEDAWMRLSVTLGKRMKPATDEVVASLTKVVEKMDEFGKKNPELTTAILATAGALAFLGAAILPLAGIIKLFGASFTVISVAIKGLGAVLGPAATALGAIVSAIGLPLILVLAAVTAAIVLFALAWKNNWGDIQGKTMAVKDWLIASITSIGEWIGQIPMKLQQMATDAGLAWENFKTQTGLAIQGTIEAIITKLNEMGTAVTTFFTNLPGQISAGIQAAGEAIVKFFVTDVPFAWGVAVGTIEKFVNETIPAAFTALMTWLTDFVTVQLPAIGTLIATFFTVTIPTAIGQWISYMQTAIPAAAEQLKTTVFNMAQSIWASIVKMKDDTIAAIIAWVNTAIANVIHMKDQAIEKAQEMYTNVKQWVTNLVNDTLTLVSKLPGIIEAQFNAAKEMAIAKAREIYEGVKGWIDKVIDLFNQIVAAAQNAINKAKEAFSLGREQGKRQFGGPVSAAASYMVGEAGTEQFTPQTAGYITPHGKYADSRAGGGGPTIQFIINADLIVNSPTERRGLAEALYTDLVTLARSQNMTVAEMLGG